MPSPPGDRPKSSSGSVTIKDIAQALGVSHSTVSRALNDHPHISLEMKEKVRQCALNLGYVVNEGARSLRGSNGRLIGLIVPNVTSEFTAMMVKVMGDRCYAAEYQMILCVTGDDSAAELHHVEMLRRNRASGVVIVPTPDVREETARLLAPMPVVQFSRISPKIEAPSVTIDDAGAVALAVDHLADLGHRRIAYIGLSSKISTGRARVHGYREAMTARGLGEEPGLCFLGPRTVEYGRTTTEALLAMSQPPSALILANADQTLGGLEALRKAAVRIPADLSVIGYGDPHWLRIFEPAISTIGFPLTDCAESAIDILLRKIEHNENEGASPSLEPFLVLRRSTAAPRRSKGQGLQSGCELGMDN